MRVHLEESVDDADDADVCVFSRNSPMWRGRTHVYVLCSVRGFFPMWERRMHMCVRETLQCGGGGHMCKYVLYSVGG